MTTGRIIRVLSGFYTVNDGHRDIVCKARGKFRKDAFKPLAGDLCDFSYDGANDGYIMAVHPRKNQLTRPPVANVDQALILVSAKEPDFSSLLLDRFLALVESHQIIPVIIITKMDLIESDSPLYETIQAYQNCGYQVITTSQDDFSNNEEIKALFKDKITVITGQSGVGKSSLLNRLTPELQLKTGVISNVLGRGKHTTRHVELFYLNDGWVADTPGFSSLDIELTERELAVSYHDFAKLSQNCKFRGCLHVSEPDCAVKEAVAAGEIPSWRYEHYLMFLNEIKNRKGKY